jgi:hypothetical protein
MISEVAADTSARGRAYAYTKVSFQVRDLILIEQPALAARA